MYYIILIQNVPILDLRRPNHVLRTYTSVRDIKGWWNSTCNSKWVTQTTKANTRIFQNGNAQKLDILKKPVILFCLSKKLWNFIIKIVTVKFYQKQVTFLNLKTRTELFKAKYYSQIEKTYLPVCYFSFLAIFPQFPHLRFLTQTHPVPGGEEKDRPSLFHLLNLKERIRNDCIIGMKFLV